MKKIIFTLLLFVSTLSNAQIYNIRLKVDKFDDIIYSHNEKTLITKTDSTITFEVKGKEPVTYGIINQTNYGTRTDEIELTGGIYGCQVTYLSIFHPSEQQALDALKKLENLKTQTDSIKWCNENIVYITHRIISTYSFKRSSKGEFPYETDLWWIQFQDGSRIIYKKN